MVNGTLINYYFHCKRQCYLHANRINLEDNSEDVRIGKILHEINEEKSKKSEISIENIKIDKLTRDYLVEVKKSDSDVESVKWQVLLYLYKLKQKGVIKKGKIEFIEKNKQDKKIHYIELDELSEKKLLKILNEIETFINQDTPPQSKFESKCRKCAYYEYCFI
ncbi:CRISPR-associated protein Cas4 [Arcobacter sp. YIC-80]|uniref:CRISPR-associated protein Cas4 n=1 Tax=Arcobacter sp. YIC-80 TaxID=3376683 RepID=UPI00384E1C32